MKIHLLLSLIALGFTLGEPIPKQALSQSQTETVDNSSNQITCEIWTAQMSKVQTARDRANQEYRRTLSPAAVKALSSANKDVADLLAQKPADC
ncbi:hypothetical protein BDV38DRAFT_278512 [Aspergillus pseudotamarii]|uniref:Uncharacterized protein n=1 Tax=Aspergillus pseudotamarii TaxID=132259 RepID=A0A5N6T7Y2_ASPPS|nr:uncharacterized protein BDV38DRAFT_278512 [Aspergillus pseudotamarii]KAE8142346.1 hypothetical protein BDV38DRAFT_278512 [Aspergillus pseudotamarii]